MQLKPDSKILIVDDMLIMRKFIKNMLTQLEFTNIESADDGATAWPLIETSIQEGKPFDIVISDWNMPTMSGVELLQKIRATPGLEKLPFLMITAEVKEDNLEIAKNAGVSEFIGKPFTIDILKEKLESISKL